MLIIVGVPAAAVALGVAAVNAESLVAHGTPPALVRWLRYLPYLALSLCLPAGLAADAAVCAAGRRLGRAGRPLVAATLVVLAAGSMVLAVASVWRDPFHDQLACSSLPIDANSEVVVLAREPSADYLSMKLFARTGASFYFVRRRVAKVRFRTWLDEHVPDLEQRRRLVREALAGGNLPPGVDVVVAPRGLIGASAGRRVATCTWDDHQLEVLRPAPS
jgi:hypothetical protein